MITQDKRLLGGVAGAVLLAAIGGFSVARYTAEPSPEAQKTENAEEGTAAHADNLAMTEEAIGKPGIAVEAVRAGGLGSDILAQATVTAAPAGAALVTARAGAAVTQVFQRTGDPAQAGETLTEVQSMA